MNLATYRFYLDKSSKKYVCPACGKKRFVRYIDSTTGRLHPDETAGRCDREQHCQYQRYPDTAKREWVPLVPPKPPVDIPRHVLDATLKNGKNPFIDWLYGLFNPEAVERVLQMYLVGTAGDWLTLPFISETGNIRAIQCKQFDKHGHGVRVDWMHSILSRQMNPLPDWYKPYAEQDCKKVTCPFGAHLLNRYPSAPVGYVEGPKTAIICTLFYGMPGTLWLAAGSKGYFTEDRIQVLKGRIVTVYPDLGAFEDWKKKADQFRFGVNGYIEKIATPEERAKGDDIADFIVKGLKNEKRNN